MQATMESTTVNTAPVQKYRVLPIMIALILGGGIGMFSETALNVALSDLINDFQITAAIVQWLTTGYLLTMGILVPISSLLLQRFTTRQLFIASLSLSVIGTLIAAMAGSFEILLTARIFQAAGTALLLPLMFNTILVIFPADKRGSAMGLLGLVMMVAPAVGPTVAGLLLDKLSWHWIFWLSLPVLIIALLFGTVYMQNVTTTSKPRIDIASILLSTIGFGGIVYGFSRAGESEAGWSSPEVLLWMIIGAVALFFFAIRQLRMKQPMMNLRVFRHPMFTFGTLMVFICMMLMMASMLVLPMFLINGLGLPALTAGLVMLPGGLLNGVMSPIMGKLFDKFGPKWLVIPGLAIVAAVLFFLSNTTTTSTLALMIILHSCLMIGISMVWMPAQTNGLNQLPQELYPDGTAIMNTLQQVSGAIGTAVAVSVMTSGITKYMAGVADSTDPANAPAALTAGVQNAFIFAMIAALVGFVMAFFIKRVTVNK